MTDRPDNGDAAHRDATLRKRAERVVADWAPMTDAQRQKVAAILNTSSTGVGAA